jgi:hypothetical protein
MQRLIALGDLAPMQERPSLSLTGFALTVDISCTGRHVFSGYADGNDNKAEDFVFLRNLLPRASVNSVTLPTCESQHYRTTQAFTIEVAFHNRDGRTRAAKQTFVVEQPFGDDEFDGNRDGTLDFSWPARHASEHAANTYSSLSNEGDGFLYHGTIPGYVDGSASKVRLYFDEKLEQYCQYHSSSAEAGDDESEACPELEPKYISDIALMYEFYDPERLHYTCNGYFNAFDPRDNWPADFVPQVLNAMRFYEF